MLFVLGAELASDEKGLARLTQTINAEDIQALEQLIDRNMAQSGPLKEFVIPGKNLASAQLHVARTLARRLERILIAMDKKLTLRDEPRRYINRLSDALFSMARIEETTPTGWRRCRTASSYATRWCDQYSAVATSPVLAHW